MTIFLTVLHVTVCVVLIVVVLLQRGKGAEIGAVFGGGAGSTVFGSRGAGNFLTKLTTGAAIIFMLTSLSLAYFSQESGESTLFEEEQAEPAAEEPVSPFAEIPAPVEEGTGEENP
jgi:preprotein translocase subunit SecG